MTVPDFQTLMRPLLEELSDGSAHSTSELRDALARRFKLSEADLAELLPSGTGKLFVNRVAWAYVYLQHAATIERVDRGVYRILERGRQLLATESDRVDVNVLRQFPEMEEFLSRSQTRRRREATATANESDVPPLERIAEAQVELNEALATDLLDRVKESDPIFFEHLVLRVLVAMGYGGSEEVAAEHVGRSGDGGIDGVINQDQLGLERLYIQAKRRTSGSVGSPEIRDFVGALDGHRAMKGVFITTSQFSPDAMSAAEGASKRVVLIDGRSLADLMIRFGVGVNTRETFAIRELDGDFFLDEMP